MIVKTAFVGSTMQLRVELRHITPTIWRSLVVPAEVTLDVLHDILQVAFGWTNSHLHDFQVADARFGMADVADELMLVDERAAPLGAVACQGTAFLYRYDYGDDWEHEITVESISEPGPGPVVVKCLEGARACPPEDCGGPPGHENLLRVLAGPTDEEHRDMKRWVGRGFDPERFNLGKVNKKLGVIGRRLERGARAGRGPRRTR
ncbi:MAG: plasmid pRiA4b ORF-3 family protein [Deltaproteobacteria bacterium]|nr:MAG: plasmid pRiA4b ORF-3 family protein [Deltaproteobacteria bacterium]